MTRRESRENLRTDPRQIAGFDPSEIWKPLADFAGFFVSTHGRVCGVDRIRTNDRLLRGRVLKPGTLPSGHKYVVFFGGHHRQVHRLVLETFAGPCPEGHEGLHFDDNAGNNHLWNLRWGTRSENSNDAIRNGKKPLGEQVYNSKLTEDRVRFIRSNAHLGLRELAQKFGVHDNAIRQVREFITWKHVV